MTDGGGCRGAHCVDCGACLLHHGPGRYIPAGSPQDTPIEALKRLIATAEEAEKKGLRGPSGQTERHLVGLIEDEISFLREHCDRLHRRASDAERAVATVTGDMAEACTKRPS